MDASKASSPKKKPPKTKKTKKAQTPPRRVQFVSEKDDEDGDFYNDNYYDDLYAETDRELEDGLAPQAEPGAGLEDAASLAKYVADLEQLLLKKGVSSNEFRRMRLKYGLRSE